jgi:hypothetical protein
MNIQLFRSLIVFTSLCLVSAGGFADTLTPDQEDASKTMLQSFELLTPDYNNQSLLTLKKDDGINFQGQCTDDDDCGVGWKCCNTSCENVDVCVNYY